MNTTLQPLLDAAEISRLIQQAGQSRDTSVKTGNRQARFGDQPARQLGSGLDFAERRAYQHGDDPRRIDWRASARSQQTLVRQYHSEIDHPACVVIDRSASMAFGTRCRLKVTQAVRAGIVAGARMAHSGASLAMLLLEHSGHWQPPQSGLPALQRAALRAARACPPTEPAYHPGWSHIGQSLLTKLPAGSRLFLFSDFSTLQPDDYKTLRQMGQHFDCQAFHIIDAAERHLPAVSPLLLDGIGRQFLVHPGSAGKATLQMRLQQHQQQLKQSLQKSGLQYRQLNSEQSLQGKL